MKRIFTLLTFFISILSVCTLSVVEGYGQLTGDNYPVQAHVYVQRPSLKMPEYFSSSTMLRTDLILKDLTKTTLDVYLSWQITGLGLGVEAGTLPGFVPPGYLTLTKGSKRQLSGAELREYFQPGILAVSGVGENVIFNGKLPEGFYTLKITAYEAGTGRQVSNTAETFFSVAYALPPVINLPLIGSEQPVTRPQSVLLQWMPRHTATGSNRITYSGKVCEVAEDEDPNVAINGSQNCFTIPAQPGTSYVLKASDLPLKVGKRYAFQVQVTDNNEQLEFQNQGYSEVSWFRFGEACKAPSGLQVNAIAAGRLNVSWNANPQATGYKLLYRSKNQTEWTEQTTLGTSVSLVSLNPELDYEFKVITICEIGNESPESEIVTWEGEGEIDEELEDLIKKVLNPEGELIVGIGPGSETNLTPTTLPETFEDLIPKDPTKIPCQSQLDSYENCSDEHPTVTVDDSGSNPTLAVGDLVTVYDYLVVLTQISGSNPYSGKGLAQMPFLNNAKVPVEFSNVIIKQKDPAHKGGCVTAVNGYFRVRTGLTPEQIRQEEIDLIHKVRTNTDPGSIYISRGQVITELGEELGTTGKDLCDGKPITEEAKQSLLKKHTLAKQGLQDWAEDAADLYSELDLDGTEVLSRIQALITTLEANIAIINSGEGCPENPDIKTEMDAIKEKIKADIEKSKEPTDNLPEIKDVVVKNITESEATITWKGDKRFTKYLVSYQTEGQGVVVKEVTGTELKLVGLTEADMYNFRIEAVGENEESDLYLSNFETLDSFFPKPQNIISERINDNTVKLVWDQELKHKSYKLVYKDKFGVEKYAYPTSNQIELKDVNPDSDYTFILTGIGQQNRTASENGVFSSDLKCDLKIIQHKEKYVLTEALTTSPLVSTCKLGSVIEWSDMTGVEVYNSPIYKTEEKFSLIKLPMQTTTYHITCKVTEGGKTKTCYTSATIEIVETDMNCEEFLLSSSSETPKFLDEITITATGCIGQFKWNWDKNWQEPKSSHTFTTKVIESKNAYSAFCRTSENAICRSSLEVGLMPKSCEMYVEGRLTEKPWLEDTPVQISTTSNCTNIATLNYKAYKRNGNLYDSESISIPKQGISSRAVLKPRYRLDFHTECRDSNKSLICESEHLSIHSVKDCQYFKVELNSQEKIAIAKECSSKGEVVWFKSDLEIHRGNELSLEGLSKGTYKAECIKKGTDCSTYFLYDPDKYLKVEFKLEKESGTNKFIASGCTLFEGKKEGHIDFSLPLNPDNLVIKVLESGDMSGIKEVTISNQPSFPLTLFATCSFPDEGISVTKSIQMQPITKPPVETCLTIKHLNNYSIYPPGDVVKLKIDYCDGDVSWYRKNMVNPSPGSNEGPYTEAPEFIGTGHQISDSPCSDSWGKQYTAICLGVPDCSSTTFVQMAKECSVQIESSAKEANAKIGQIITLTAKYCDGGEVVWEDGSSGYERIVRPTEASNIYTVTCITQCNSQCEKSINIRTTYETPPKVEECPDFKLELTRGDNPLVNCAENKVTVTPIGCKGKLKWYDEDAYADPRAAKTFTLYQATTVYAVCELYGKTFRAEIEFKAKNKIVVSNETSPDIVSVPGNMPVDIQLGGCYTKNCEPGHLYYTIDGGYPTYKKVISGRFKDEVQVVVTCTEDNSKKTFKIVPKYGNGSCEIKGAAFNNSFNFGNWKPAQDDTFLKLNGCNKDYSIHWYTQRYYPAQYDANGNLISASSVTDLSLSATNRDGLTIKRGGNFETNVLAYCVSNAGESINCYTVVNKKSVAPTLESPDQKEDNVEALCKDFSLQINKLNDEGRVSEIGERTAYVYLTSDWCRSFKGGQGEVTYFLNNRQVEKLSGGRSSTNPLEIKYPHDVSLYRFSLDYTCTIGDKTCNGIRKYEIR